VRTGLLRHREPDPLRRVPRKEVERCLLNCPARKSKLSASSMTTLGRIQNLISNRLRRKSSVRRRFRTPRTDENIEPNAKPYLTPNGSRSTSNLTNAVWQERETCRQSFVTIPQRHQSNLKMRSVFLAMPCDQVPPIVEPRTYRRQDRLISFGLRPFQRQDTIFAFCSPSVFWSPRPKATGFQPVQS
jgi:hypothetical protein